MSLFFLSFSSFYKQPIVLPCLRASPSTPPPPPFLFLLLRVHSAPGSTCLISFFFLLFHARLISAVYFLIYLPTPIFFSRSFLTRPPLSLSTRSSIHLVSFSVQCLFNNNNPPFLTRVSSQVHRYLFLFSFLIFQMSPGKLIAFVKLNGSFYNGNRAVHSVPSSSSSSSSSFFFFFIFITFSSRTRFIVCFIMKIACFRESPAPSKARHSRT